MHLLDLEDVRTKKSDENPTCILGRAIHSKFYTYTKKKPVGIIHVSHYFQILLNIGNFSHGLFATNLKHKKVSGRRPHTKLPTNGSLAT